MDGTAARMQRAEEPLTPDKRERRSRVFRAPARFDPETAKFFFVDCPLVVSTLYGDIECARGDIVVSGTGGCWVMEDPSLVVVRKLSP